jgi:hypothetical protein
MNIFNQLVVDDSAGHWADLQEKVQKAVMANKHALTEGYGISDDLATEEQIRNAPAGHVWVEMADGFDLLFEVVPGRYSSLPWAGCYFAPADQYLKAEDGDDYPKYFLAEKSWIANPWQSSPNVTIPVFSYVVISCPRCEVLWKHEFGEDEEFDRDAATEDCVSCKGTGEWVFDT